MPHQLLAPADDVASDVLVRTQTATTRVKEKISEGVAKGWDESTLTEELNKCIYDACKTVQNDALREQMRRALVTAARKWHYELKMTYRILDDNLTHKAQTLDLDITDLMSGGTPYVRMQEFRKVLDEGTNPGVPIIKDYWQGVKLAMKAMSADPPKVYAGSGAIVPLRLRAEMAVRYAAAVENLQNLIDAGVRFCWISSHSSCSPRCAPYQGKLYSLFRGTVTIGGREYGEHGTIDGIPYRPISEAMAGPKGDGNGCISGYNCRHRAIEYRRGSRPPQDYTEAQMKKEYAVDRRQRAYENQIRQLKTEERQLRAAGMTKDASELRKKWRRLTRDYEIYSIQHDRAFYRYRCAVDSAELQSNAKVPLTEEAESGTIKSDELHPATLANVPLGKPMSFEEANMGRANPNFHLGGGFKINCQSCVVCYEARLRGYNVETLPNQNNPAAKALSRQTNLAWIDPTTEKPPEYIFSREAKTPAKFYEFLESVIAAGCRYTMEFSWKGRNAGAHIISVDRQNDALRFYDPQSGRTYSGNLILRYLREIKFETSIYGHKFATPPKILRIDNLKFNQEYVDKILKRSDSSDEGRD